MGNSRRMSLYNSRSPGADGSPARPLSARSSLRVTMITPVLRSRLVGEHFIVGHVVPIHVVARGTANNGRTGAQITDQRGDRNVHDIIAKAPTVRPATGNGAAAETSLDGAGEDVAAEN